ncbi:MAG: polysaccharide biosynthesis C-terminal domain-containing protein [Oscillospiraceae bacterium]|nr:polysaccharide biosynthesis C-terminal domain-containing protein [Oscillospiraceae bacterium]
MRKKDKYQYLLQNTLLFTIASIGTSLISFFLLPLYTAALSTDSFGVVDLLDVSSLLLFYIVSLDFSDVVGRFSLDDSLHKPMVLRIAIDFLIKTGTLAAAAILIASIVDVFHWECRYYLYLLLLYAGTATSLTLSQYLKGIDKVPVITIASIAAAVTKLGAALVLLFGLHMGIDGYVFANLLGMAVSILIYLYGMRGQAVFERHIDPVLRQAMIRYTLPLAVNALGWWIAQGVDKYFVTYFHGYSTNGIYSVAYKLPSVITILCNIFTQAFYLSAVKEIGSKERGAFFNKTFGAYHTLLCIACSMLILCNVWFTDLLFPESYFHAWRCAPWLILSSMFTGFSGYFGGLCDAVKQTRVLAASTLLSAAINILLDFLLIPRYGMEGAAVATMVSVYVVFLIRYLYIRKALQVRFAPLKEHAVFGLLIVQTLLELQEDHFYWAQCLVTCAILLICQRDMRELMQRAVSLLPHRKEH